MYNIVKIIKKQQVVYGIIIEMNQVILFLLILNLLNIKQVLKEILIILLMVKKGMMQIKLVKMKLKFPLKLLSNFWKSLNVPPINYEVELILAASKNCVLAEMTVGAAESDNRANVAPTLLEFKITDTKLYVPVVTFSKENDIKLLVQLN